MATNDGSNSVAIVAILIIVLIAAAFVYFFFMHGEIKTPGTVTIQPTTVNVPAPATPTKKE